MNDEDLKHFKSIMGTWLNNAIDFVKTIKAIRANQISIIKKLNEIEDELSRRDD